MTSQHVELMKRFELQEIECLKNETWLFHELKKFVNFASRTTVSEDVIVY